MKSDSLGRLFANTGGLLGAWAVNQWMRTLDYRAAFYDPHVDPVHPATTPRIYVFWHENILFPLYLRGRCRLTMLLSRHRDADVLARVAHHMGFECVRGSTFRGATTALRELAAKGKSQHLTLTPDGPRGPRRRLAQGPIYLASKLQLPIVAMGFGYDRPWRLKSWDRFAMPKPFSRARAVVSPPLEIPPRLNREQSEVCRVRLERLLTQLTVEAEAWAQAGTRKVGEVPIRQQPLSKRPHALSRIGPTPQNRPTHATARGGTGPALERAA